MQKRKGKSTRQKTSTPQLSKQEQVNTQPPKQSNSMDLLKDRLKQANKGGLLDMLNKVKNTKPDEWKDPSTVRDMAKQLAQQFNLPVSEDRLNKFADAFKDATKGGEPKSDVDSLIKKYGAGKIDEKTAEEMKKFIK